MLGMKRIAPVKLLPTPEQVDALRHTMEPANAACRLVRDPAWETKTFRQSDLHHPCHQAVREQFGLSAQVAVRAMAKVADACKLDRQTRRTCPACGPIDKANRPSQSRVSGVVCGYAGLADHIAAVNISRRAAVNPPIVARDDAKAVLTELRQSAVTSHPL